MSSRQEARPTSITPAWLMRETSAGERIAVRVLLLLAGPLRFVFSMIGPDTPGLDFGLVAYFTYFMLPYGLAAIVSFRSPRHVPALMTLLAIVLGEIWSLAAVASAPASTEVIAWGFMPIRQLALAAVGLTFDWGLRRGR